MDTLSNLTIKETLRELKEIHQGSTKLTAYDHPMIKDTARATAQELR